MNLDFYRGSYRPSLRAEKPGPRKERSFIAESPRPRKANAPLPTTGRLGQDKPRILSDPAQLGERYRLAVADHEVVEHPHLDQRQGILERAGQLAVGLARLGDPRRMVVGEDQRRGVVRQGALDHLAGVDAGAVDGAAEQRRGIF